MLCDWMHMWRTDTLVKNAMQWRLFATTSSLFPFPLLLQILNSSQLLAFSRVSTVNRQPVRGNDKQINRQPDRQTDSQGKKPYHIEIGIEICIQTFRENYFTVYVVIFRNITSLRNNNSRCTFNHLSCIKIFPMKSSFFVGETVKPNLLVVLLTTFRSPRTRDSDGFTQKVGLELYLKPLWLGVKTQRDDSKQKILNVQGHANGNTTEVSYTINFINLIEKWNEKEKL